MDGGPGTPMRGTFDFDAAPFDWGEAEKNRSRVKWEDLVIYEVPIRSFSGSPCTPGVSDEERGTYLGLAKQVRGLLTPHPHRMTK